MIELLQILLGLLAGVGLGLLLVWCVVGPLLVAWLFWRCTVAVLRE
jgi:hypothetical protein